jgi:hypothetical protein
VMPALNCSIDMLLDFICNLIELINSWIHA